MPTPGARSVIYRAIEDLGRRTLGFIEDLGATAMLGARVPLLLLRPPWRSSIWFQQLEAVGVGSLFIVTLTGLFVGAVLALQSLRAFGLFNAESLVGATVELGLARTLAPVFTGLMLTARTGSAIATELGTMRVTEQIDALETMAVDSRAYLIAPRVLAGFVMTPLLTLIFNAMGLLGAYLVTVVSAGLSGADFQARISTFTDMRDIAHGLEKSAVFGYVICLVACQRGFCAEGGAAGVGVATTRAVVGGSVSVLALDYCLTTLYYVIRPPSLS
jgi:phospholipid/cholesterol/gamma-HCH transport system permease protein